MQHVLRKILEPENAGIKHFGGKDDLVLAGGLGVEMELDLEIRGRHIARIHIDRDVDVGWPC